MVAWQNHSNVDIDERSASVRRGERTALSAEARHSLGNGFEARSAPFRSDIRALLEALDEHAIVAATDASGTIRYVNNCFCRISGFAEEELIGRKHSILNSGHHPRGFFVDLWKVITSGAKWHGEICNRTKGGELYWVDTTIVPMTDREGRIQGYLSVRVDITERKKVELALAEENNRRLRAETLLRHVIEAVPVGITAFGDGDRLLFCNEAFKRFYPDTDLFREGDTYETVIRRMAREGYFAGVGENEIETWVAKRLAEHRSSNRPVVLALADGRWIQLREFRTEDGLTVTARTDVTELKEAERTIRKQAEEDPLTGLANRTVILGKVERLLSRSRSQRAALVLIDLDNFKAVNDSLGHDAGDELLVVIGRRLAGAVRKDDMVGRMGGDEFALVMTDVASDQALARRLDRVMVAAQQPVALTGRTVTPRLSMGAIGFGPNELSRKDIFQRADSALYQAKAAGRGRYYLFDRHLLKAVEHRRRRQDVLRDAIEGDALRIELQPQIHLATGAHVGFEALARWRHGGEEVPPADFIQLAEESGLIVALGARIVEHTLQFAGRMKAMGLRPGRMAINVAAAQLKLDDFAETLSQQISLHGMTPGDIEIEITETVLLDRAAGQIGHTIDRLRSLGVNVSLDDFGTGYASLAHLKRFQVHRLKIDRSFVADIGADEQRCVIPSTIISLAHSLGMEVVAEGIENDVQLACLRTYGCDIGQGYLFARPMALAQAETYLRGL